MEAVDEYDHNPRGSRFYEGGVHLVLSKWVGMILNHYFVVLCCVFGFGRGGH